ncbi:hypothetical protein BDW02DRAFT_644532 [Decorospora gaudefroyi]|uniref:Uncharacterized protein n=1 Tax=Decorospora gaudefroyi TaxID=184978 RepID=A0A6A5KSY7_9PLEO|nr:hypothetical protein BDW02DRAFT_644532 [Decorospora gaudefroyi]
MLFSKPFTAGLVLAALLAISHARAIDKELCLYEPNDAACAENPTLHVSAGSLRSRAPPRVPGRPGDDVGDGTGAQTGNQQAGGNQGGKQDGESAQTGNQGAGGTPGAPGPANAGQGTVNLPPPLAPYADLPANYQPRVNGVPGRDTLPNEIPNFNGISPSADDAFRRASMQRLINWDIQSSITFNQPNYLLFNGREARDARVPFKADFNNNNREGVNMNNKGTLIDVDDVYRNQARGDDAIPIPEGWDPNNWHGILQSYGIAQRAAQNDRTVRVLVEGKDGVYSRDRLLQEGSYFYNFELWTITSPSSRVPNVVVYRADAPNEAGVEVWRRGMPPMGKRPDFIAGTLPDSQRVEVISDLIDLGVKSGSIACLARCVSHLGTGAELTVPTPTVDQGGMFAPPNNLRRKLAPQHCCLPSDSLSHQQSARFSETLIPTQLAMMRQLKSSS